MSRKILVPLVLAFLTVLVILVLDRFGSMILAGDQSIPPSPTVVAPSATPTVKPTTEPTAAPAPRMETWGGGEDRVRLDLGQEARNPGGCRRGKPVIDVISPELQVHLTDAATETLAGVTFWICPYMPAWIGWYTPETRNIVVGETGKSARRQWMLDHEALHAMNDGGKGRLVVTLAGVSAEIQDWALSDHPWRWDDTEMFPYAALYYDYEPAAMPPDLAASIAPLLQ